MGKFILFSVVILVLSFCAFPVNVQAQEPPSIDIVHYDANATFRTDLCERQRQLYNDEILLSDSLQGINMSVYILDGNDENDWLFHLTQNGKIDEEDPGIMAEILDALALKAGFKWRDTFAVHGVPNPKTDGNKTWTDRLLWSTDKFDISARTWTRTISRMKLGVSFFEGWVDENLIMVVPVGTKAEIDIFSFLKPFDSYLWLLIGAAIVFTGFSYHLLEKINGSSDDRDMEDEASPMTALFLSALTFTGHFDMQPNTSAARILAVSWTFWALITSAAYTANLASFLVIKNAPQIPIQSMDQAVQTGVPICIHGNTAHDDYLSKTYPNANFVRKESIKDAFIGVSNRECAVAASSVAQFKVYERDPEVNVGCSLQWVGRNIASFSGGFATTIDTGIMCTSLVSHALEMYMIELKDEGFIDNVWEKYLKKRGDQNCVDPLSQSKSTSTPTVKRLGVYDMAGIFILHAIVCVIVIFIALLQYCFVKRRTPS